MDVLDNQLVADTFPQDGAGGAIAQLGPIFDSNGGYYAVKTNAVYAQYAYGRYGEYYWTDPVPIPVGPAILEPGTVGVRFKNYTAGSAARIDGALSEKGEPAVQITAGGVAGAAGAALVTGEVILWAGNIASPPSGLLVCDGSAILRASFTNLFNVIGVLYGAGDGSTTFNLPDLRDRVPLGIGTGGNTTTPGTNEGVAVANRNKTRHRHTPHLHGLVVQTFVAGGSTVPQMNTNVQTQTINTNSADGGSGVAADPLDGPAFLGMAFLIQT